MAYAQKPDLVFRRNVRVHLHRRGRQFSRLLVCASAAVMLDTPYSDGSDRGQLKCDGTRAETRFRLSVKRTSPFKSAGASVQSTAGSRGVRISGSNAEYNMFRGSVKGTG